MRAEIIWYGLALLAFVTVYWAAVWWWLPKYFDKRERKRDDGAGDRDP